MLAPVPLMLLLAAKSHTLYFPTTSIDLGIRHIHTPEHLVKSHPLTFPNFNIFPNVSKPVVHKGCSMVAFDFEVGFTPRRYTARMFSSHCCRSQLLIMDSDFQSCAYISLSVVPHGAAGHALSVDIVPYMQVSRLASILAPVWQKLNWLQGFALWGYDAGPIQANLRKYRLCVMHPETVLDHI